MGDRNREVHFKEKRIKKSCYRRQETRHFSGRQKLNKYYERQETKNIPWTQELIWFWKREERRTQRRRKLRDRKTEENRK
jgi:hypothetical protein